MANPVGRRRRKKSKHRNTLSFFVMGLCAVLSLFLALHDYKNTKPTVPAAAPPTPNAVQIAAQSTAPTTPPSEGDWQLALVNKWNPLAPDADPAITTLSNGERVDTRIYAPLQAMFDAARDNGVYPVVASGYRTAQEQQQIYDDKLNAYKAEGLSDAEARAETDCWVAAPGTSEHQLGLAVDINADGVHSAGEEVYAWLKDNAHLYGFINRYPADKTELTGVSNEPWHYRYVGVDAATAIYGQGVCLEEYLGAAAR